MNIIVTDKSKFDKNDARKKINSWINSNFALMAGYEMVYYDIKPKIICEPLLRENMEDYKCMCFNGKVYCIWVDVDRYIGHKRNFYSPTWKKLAITYINPNSPKIIPRPKYLAEMIDLAETLAKGFAHARIDFYILPNDELKFGEFTFYSQTGVGKFTPIDIDYQLGKLINLEGELL